jgi:hypothetical protein
LGPLERANLNHWTIFSFTKYPRLNQQVNIFQSISLDIYRSYTMQSKLWIPFNNEAEEMEGEKKPEWELCRITKGTVTHLLRLLYTIILKYFVRLSKETVST